MSESSDTTNGVRNPNIHHVSVKIPNPFPNVILWFKQVDASFELSRVTDEVTKYFHLISNLPAEILMKYQSHLDASTPHPYTNLRGAMVKDFENKTKLSVADMLKDNSLGNRSPSEALRQIRYQTQLLDPSNHDPNSALIRELFMRLLPGNVQIILLAQPSEDLSHQAALADKIINVKHSENSSACMALDTVSECTLKEEVLHLREEINELRRRQAYQNDSRFCYYHKTFGNNARKCQPPCEWKNRTVNPGNAKRFH